MMSLHDVKILQQNQTVKRPINDDKTKTMDDGHMQHSFRQFYAMFQSNSTGQIQMRLIDAKIHVGRVTFVPHKQIQTEI